MIQVPLILIINSPFNGKKIQKKIKINVDIKVKLLNINKNYFQLRNKIYINHKRRCRLDYLSCKKKIFKILNFLIVFKMKIIIKVKRAILL